MIVCGDAREVLAGMDAESVHACITSPPYWGLRDYSDAVECVFGGDEGCRHEFEGEVVHEHREEPTHAKSRTTERFYGGDQTRCFSGNHQKHVSNQFCVKCGAWRGQFGLEPTPEMYVEHTLEFLRAIRRVLRKDGTCWLNLGDSYASSGTGGFGATGGRDKSTLQSRMPPMNTCPVQRQVPSGLKPKDLVMIPFRVALAAQNPLIHWLVPEEGWRGWLAGLIDADGTIGIHHYHRNDGTYEYDQFQPYVTVHMGDVEALEMCQQLTGYGSIRRKSKAGTGDARGIRSTRDTYAWRVEGNAVAEILADIYPWLVVKNRQAKIAYALWEGKQKVPHTRQGRPVPKSEIERRFDLWQRIKAANQRADVDTADLGDVPIKTDDGWWVRSVIIYAKKNPMPESVRDRPTTSHEYVLLLTKSAKYFMDMDAIREPQTGGTHSRGKGNGGPKVRQAQEGEVRANLSWADTTRNVVVPGGRNKRTIWTIATQPYPEAHFATFPEALVEPMILTTPTKCCAECGAGWERVTEQKRLKKAAPSGNRELGRWSVEDHGALGSRMTDPVTVGFRPTCSCNGETKPAVVLDPFAGRGTVARGCRKNNRDWVMIEMNPDYIPMMERYLAMADEEVEKQGETWVQPRMDLTSLQK